MYLLDGLGVRNLQVVFIFGWTITWPFASKTESQKAFYRSIFTSSTTKAASDPGLWCFLWKLLFENRRDDDLPCSRPEDHYLQNTDMSEESGWWNGFKYCIIKHVPCQICSDVCLEKQVYSPLLNKVLFWGLTVSWLNLHMFVNFTRLWVSDLTIQTKQTLNLISKHGDLSSGWKIVFNLK